MDNATWVVEEGDRIIQKKARLGFNCLTDWERLVYSLWVADYGMRNAGDLSTARDVYTDFQSVALNAAKILSLPTSSRAFSLAPETLQEQYFGLFEAVCDEIRSAEPCTAAAAGELHRRPPVHIVDDIAILLGKPLDRDVITAVVCVEGRELPGDYDPGHPEDERHDYIVPSLGLQFLAGPDRIIRSAFFMLEGDENVSSFPWTLANGIGPASTQSEVRSRLGKPEASGAGSHLIKSLQPTGPWDRFSFPPFGFLHVQYKPSVDGITQITLMDPSAAPRDG
jgi:hypothetical protein